MSKNPFFSIIVPIYNVELYLNKCIDSVLSQTFHDYELILVDDGSQDNCPKICDECASQNSCIKVVHKKNSGASYARNAGLDMATGHYIMFLDSDDYWCDEMLLEKLKERIELYNEDIILLGVKNINCDKSEVITRGNYDFEILNLHDKIKSFESLENTRNYPGSAWVMCVRHSLINDLHLRFKCGVTGEDIEWIFILLINCVSIGAIDGIHYAYVFRDNSVTSNPKYSFILGFSNAFDVYLKENPNIKLLDTYVKKLYLQAVMNYNQLSKDDKIMAVPQLNKYLNILKVCHATMYYYFIRILGLPVCSFLIDYVYKKFYAYK